jgi:hypothetical protein
MRSHTNSQGTKEVEGQYVPNVATDILTETKRIISIVFTNDSGAANPKVTLLDKQNVPVAFMFGQNTSVPAGNAVEWHCPDPEGWPATGGLTWSCDTADAVIGRIKYIA